MPTFDASTGTCEITTYKAGLLAAVGHDLVLRVNAFSLTIDDDHVEGTFDGTSFEVLGALKNGVIETGVLSNKDCRDILDNIRKYVFKGFRAASIRFESDEVEVDEDSIEGEGTLFIPPAEHKLDFEVNIDNGQAVCEVVLHQPDWGIKPFSALMGALKVKPDIKVRVTVPWDG